MKAWLMAAAVVWLAGSAAAQPVQEWRVTVQQTSGNSTSCASGGSATIRVRDGTLSMITSHPEPMWTIKPAPDGSFDAVVPTAVSRRGSRVMVPGGTGPREIATLQQSQACGYRLLPQ